MNNQHSSGGLFCSLGRKILIFFALYCFALWWLHSVISLEEGKQNVLDTSTRQQRQTPDAEKGANSSKQKFPTKLQDKLDEEYRIHGRPFDGENFARFCI